MKSLLSPPKYEMKLTNSGSLFVSRGDILNFGSAKSPHAVGIIEVLDVKNDRIYYRGKTGNETEWGYWEFGEDEIPGGWVNDMRIVSTTSETSTQD